MYENLPLVEFEYPDSETNHQKLRFVRVLKKDNAHLTGYELSHANATDKGTYKKYSLSRIVRNGISLREFTAPPQNND